MRALVLIVMALSVAACGSGSSSGGAAAPPPASPAPEPGGNPTTAQPTAPTEPTEPTAPQPDRFVDVERLDQNAECDALVPSNVPAPISIKADATGTGCGRGTSEGTGHVAAIDRFTSHGPVWQVFGPEGRPEQWLSVQSDLWPQREGWQGVQSAWAGAAISLTLLTFFADGSPRRSEQPQPGGFIPNSWTFAPDPLGGAVIVWWGSNAPGPDADCLGEARRFDATGAPVGSAGRIGCGVVTAGVSMDGETLVAEVLTDGSGATVLRWLRADGTPARGPSRDAYSAYGELVPLLDGSLVLLQGNTYVRQYLHLAVTSAAAPAWLAARAGQAFRFTRGNAGYAFFPPPGAQSSDCTQNVELVAPSGRRCVKLTFRRDGNACVTGSIDQGWDGTVVQQSSSGACGWRFWPRLLAGG